MPLPKKISFGHRSEKESEGKLNERACERKHEQTKTKTMKHAMKHFVVKEKLWSYCGVIGKQEVTKGIVMARMS